MHILKALPGQVTDGSQAVDLKQTPADVVILSAAESELNGLSQAHGFLVEKYGHHHVPSLRLASLLSLGHPFSVDLYVQQVISSARFVVIRVLGGQNYWSYGIEQVRKACLKAEIPVAFFSGDDRPDADLMSISTLDMQTYDGIWRYISQGGNHNSQQMLRLIYHLLDPHSRWQPQRAENLEKYGFYWPEKTQIGEGFFRDLAPHGAPHVLIIFYRALVQSGNTMVIDALIQDCVKKGMRPVPIYVSRLKDEQVIQALEQTIKTISCQAIINATAFCVRKLDDQQPAPFEKSDIPVFQVIFAGSNYASWQEGLQGLTPQDMAMNVALAEVDGRIITRAVSFKAAQVRDELTQFDRLIYEVVDDRVSCVVSLVKSWVDLRQTSVENKKVVFVMANYPNRDARLGNGVGLDAPESVMLLLKSLVDDGYHGVNLPENSHDLMHKIRQGVTNDWCDVSQRHVEQVLPLSLYEKAFSALPEDVRSQMIARWGKPEKDPFFLSSKGGFALPVVCFGHLVVGIQPARGYNIDPAQTYHCPDLVPPHSYFAFYVWIRDVFQAHALVQMGKHGNMEWLPGKSVALSKSCWPEAMGGMLPHIYPFIVNDPGEGSQAKRRTQAVVVDHLTPPLMRAETYGVLGQLEKLLDEYFEAALMDKRRLPILKENIFSLCRVHGLDESCQFRINPDEEDLGKLDAYLCELKERQIRHGLHILGQPMDKKQLDEFLVALVRVPRLDGQGHHQSLIGAMAHDFQLNVDPLALDMSHSYQGPKPEILVQMTCDPWRTCGDTLERLELLAVELVSQKLRVENMGDFSMDKTRQVLDFVFQDLKKCVMSCPELETKAISKALQGRFVPPGPSGAPTRGRLDVLPTGRNFYAVDTRALPTYAAWNLGWKSAHLLLERYVQDHGQWMSTMAMSMWGTSTMRTGGDDMAQVLALMGVKPCWDDSSGRVKGIEVIPLDVLGRPRVDVTVRISGFFRDAFGHLVDLFDQAVSAVCALENESKNDNPLAHRVGEDTAILMAQGHHEQQAKSQAKLRMFGSKPGAYGAGLQALIDEKGWHHVDDLVQAYISWGGYGYQRGSFGQPHHDVFQQRLKQCQAVVQNQDNYEHDILDSDDYYQFEGGLGAAVESFSSKAPAIYHGDHSRPQSPKIRSLKEEIDRVVRSRAVNPKWIKGVQKHGYKGAFEMAATVDYLFAFCATTKMVSHHHFQAVFDAYLKDDAVRQWMDHVNPHARMDIAQRLNEAIERGLWRPQSNHVIYDLEKYQK